MLATPRRAAARRVLVAFVVCCTYAAVARATGESASGVALLAPGVLSTGDSESHATLSPDGKQLYFVKLSPDFGHFTILVSERAGVRWSEPAIASFSGRWDDTDVSFAPDGNTLYFVSDRPDDASAQARPDTDVFRSRRGAAGWSEPERIREVSSPGNEWFPNQAANGTLYFGSERRPGNLGAEGTADLWRARWLGDHYAEPESLGGAINSAGQEIEPWIAPDESLLIFAAKGRGDSLGSYDLYASRACDGEWSAPQPLGGGVNSPYWDFGGRFSPDGTTFYFGSNRPVEPAPRRLQGVAGYRALLMRLRAPSNGLFDIYAVPAAALTLPGPC